MKRKIMGLMAILAMAVACQKNESFPQEADTTLYATMENVSSTRTMLDDNNNVLWSEGDQIVAFMKTSLGLKYQVTAESVGKTAARFTKISTGNPDDLYAGSELSHNVAYYPYSDIANCMRSGENYEISVILPTEQTYTANSFGNGSLPMVAVSEDNNITFRNVCGGLKLQLKGTQKVTSIKLEGKNGEKLSGAATVTAYTDETKPAITMESGASTSVSLNCGTDVQLNESTATEFIIALPPVLFGSGFTVTVIDADSQTYTIETSKTNTVLRSSLLVMPAVTLGASVEGDSGDDDELIVPVSYVNLSSTSLELYEGNIAQLTATVGPKDATDKTVIWSSDNPAVVSVDQTGLVTAFLSGSAKISAAAGGKVATCSVTVSTATVPIVDYIDEYGVNHGKGTAIGMAVWAPVNCGYHKDDYKYGKLYQWGRKYGQGYSGNLFDVDSSISGTYYDSTVPTIEEGGVSVVTGNHNSKSNVFYTDINSGDWVDPQDGKLWNSGSDSKPDKTEYDPCPAGWRVPTCAELSELFENYSSWTTDEKGQVGLWFSGACLYTETVSQVFFPAAGYRYSSDGEARHRGYSGYYWSSRSYYSNDSFYSRSYCLYFNNSYAQMSYYHDHRARGYSVRCVQE